MSPQRRILLAGLGAMMPVILNLAVVDMSSIVNQFTLIACLGYAIRVVVLFFIGGLVGFLNSDETSPTKVLQFGIGAPAMLLALANGTHIPDPATSDPKATASSFQIISSAYADDFSAKRYQLPSVSAAKQFWNGFTGQPVTNVWFVIAQDDLDLAGANDLITQVRRDHPDLNPQLYFMYGQTAKYAVVVGANLQQADASALASRLQNTPDLQHVKTWKLPTQ